MAGIETYHGPLIIPNKIVYGPGQKCSMALLKSVYIFYSPESLMLESPVKSKYNLWPRLEVFQNNL